MCAPGVVNALGAREDSARHFPTPFGRLKKAFGGPNRRLEYPTDDRPFPAPWVAGMFMLFRSTEFAAVSGFDEGSSCITKT
jgi:GT2 family glycosyltransferase